MSAVPIKIKLLRPEAIAPRYAHPGEDAAFDVFSCCDLVCENQTRYILKLGIASEIPQGYFIKIETKSGMAAKGFVVAGGVIDSGYRGEWGLVIYYTGMKDYWIEKGKAIAQCVLHKIPEAEIQIVDQLASSQRGENAWGSGHTSKA